MQNDVIWIVTDETPTTEYVEGERGGVDRGNPYEPTREFRTQQRRGIPVSADKLEQGMSDFVQVMGRVLEHVKSSAADVGGMELEEIELSVEVNGEGQVSLFGTGGKAGGKGAMTLKFKAPKKSVPASAEQKDSLG